MTAHIDTHVEIPALNPQAMAGVAPAAAPLPVPAATEAPLVMPEGKGMVASRK